MCGIPGPEKVAGTKAARTAPNKPASAISISISMSTCANCDRQVVPARAEGIPNVPDGQISKLLSSPLRENIPVFNHPKSGLETPPFHPSRGALAIVTNVGMGCGGRGSVGRARDGRVGFKPGSDHRAPDERRQSPAKPFGEDGWLRTAKPCGPGTRCWCQVGGGFGRPNRVRQNRQFADDGDKTNSSPGRARHKP